MKKNRIKPFVFLLLFFIMSNLQAQETVSTTGGEAKGDGGTISYTIGQVVYSTHKDADGYSLAQGVQQPYEISVITGISEAQDINLSLLAYPNPTTDYLIVKVEHYNPINLQYLVFDVNGKLIQTVKATGQETKIETNKLVNGSYFVKVLDNINEIKVFKIVKN